MKNLKKGLAVAMSLAMIATVMPTMKVDAATVVCNSVVSDAAKNMIGAMKADLAEAKKKLADISIDESLAVWTKTDTLIDADFSDTATITDLLGKAVTAGTNTSTETLAEALKVYIACTENPDTFAATLVSKEDDFGNETIIEKVGGLKTALASLNTQFNATNGTYKDGIENKTAYDLVKPVYDEIVAYYNTYKGNLATADKTAHVGYYNDYFNDMESAVEEFEESFIGDFTDDFVTALKAKAVITGVTVDDLVNGTKAFNYSNLTTLETFIKDLKDDKITLTIKVGAADKEVVKYSTVAEEDDVVDLVEGLETIVDDLKEVKELLKSTSKIVKDYKGLKTEINALAGAVTPYDSETDAYDKKLAAFRSDDIAKLTTYVEEVVEQFYEVESVKRTSGNYTLRLKDTEFARYVTENDVFTSTIDLKTLLITNIVKDEEESVYDELTGNQNEVDKLLAAVAAIENIKVNDTFTSAQATKIMAARKAYIALVGKDGTQDYYSLTRKEKNAVLANGDLIEVLYAKLILTGTITESGWIDLGNGNWDYINADGSKSTKWVAAGKDWYFVQAGHMLRNSWVAQDATGAVWYYVDNAGKMVVNTTIEGYVINANGEWHKK